MNHRFRTISIVEWLEYRTSLSGDDNNYTYFWYYISRAHCLLASSFRRQALRRCKFVHMSLLDWPSGGPEQFSPKTVVPLWLNNLVKWGVLVLAHSNVRAPLGILGAYVRLCPWDGGIIPQWVAVVAFNASTETFRTWLMSRFASHVKAAWAACVPKTTPHARVAWVLSVSRGCFPVVGSGPLGSFDLGCCSPGFP